MTFKTWLRQGFLNAEVYSVLAESQRYEIIATVGYDMYVVKSLENENSICQ